MATKKTGTVKSTRITIESPFKAKGLTEKDGKPVATETKAILYIKKAVAEVLGFPLAEVKPKKGVSIKGVKGNYTRDIYYRGSYRQKSFTVLFNDKGVQLPASSGSRTGSRASSTVKRTFYSVSFGVPQQVSVSDVMEYFFNKKDARIVGIRTPNGKTYRFNSSAQ